MRPSSKGQRSGQRRSRCTSTQSSFNGLPAEIKSIILRASLGVTNLRSLVKSSPAYHAVYLDQRKSILCSVLTSSIGLSGLVKALAALAIREIERGEEWPRRCEAFLNKYIDDLQEFCQDSVSLEDLISVSRLEFNLLVVAKEFCIARLSRHPLSHETIFFDMASLSRSEYRRIRRAFLHFEICTALVGEFNAENRTFNVHRQWSRILSLFMKTIEVWESEELESIYDFVMFYYDRIFKQDRKPIRKIFNRVAVRHTRSDRHAPLYNVLRIWETNLTCCGFQLFANVCKASSAASRVELIRPYLKTDVYTSRFLYTLICNYLELIFRQRPIAKFSQDQIQRSKETPFTFDEVECGPNSAWTWAVPQHLWGRYHAWGSVYLRSWGYVMWDKTRLLDLGILQRDPTEYQSIHGPYELRESLLSERSCICRTTPVWNTLRKLENGHSISQCRY
ncbi:hypothetical protein BGZ60DRAFT_436016 [Tricladium varicosporioides]|nr:hypothetical protein BGZ60DRAFT_436016 [Hymenoscyphus varicosporioides]